MLNLVVNIIAIELRRTKQVSIYTVSHLTAATPNTSLLEGESVLSGGLVSRFQTYLLLSA